VTALLTFENVTKRHGPARNEATVLERVSFELEPGDFAGVFGEPRSGKSTLLRLAAGIDIPDAGVVRFRGLSLQGREGADSPRRSIAFAPSAATPWLSAAGSAEVVLRHVAVPLIAEGLSAREARARARGALDRIGSGTLARALTSELSVGERTRVGIARALVREPKLLLVDEPAAVQGPGARDDVRDLLRSLNRELGMTLMVASDDLSILRPCHTLFSIGGGELVSSHRPAEIVPFPGGRDESRSSQR
jgi:lipoprotein-releasing system ATP-binding protein